MRIFYVSIILFFLFISHTVAQSCPSPATTTLSTNPDTYYPATASATAGATGIVLGPAVGGTMPIAAGDMVLIIQMQGAHISSVNTSYYGDSTGAGSGYVNNGGRLAGNMEFAVAVASVPLSGGTLTLKTGLANTYVNSNYGTEGQYRFQVIRFPLITDIVLGATITAPAWNGNTGGIVVLNATNSINLNNHTVSAADSGFRGGAGRKLTGGTGAYTDVVTLSTGGANGSKGEGLAGTPRYLYYRGALLDNGSAREGYPNGSYARGAPGNAGAGATDGTPTTNAENAGGGGGGNGGAGGAGGQGWSASVYSGGFGGSVFGQVSPSSLVMGGGGGAGDSNDGSGTPGAGLASSGASGGGIVIMVTNTFLGNGTVDVSGQAGNTTVVQDGSGGGGAGGSALIFASSGTSGITVNASGGTGGSNLGAGGTIGRHGPGGGGGGGVVYSSGALGSVNVDGGAAGTTFAGTTNYDATAGGNGSSVLNVSSSALPGGALGCITLPVTFLSVSATYQSGIVNVSWSVAQELDVRAYAVQRSTDGITFQTVGTVPRQSANYNGVNDYSYDDSYKGELSVLYYRVVEEDNTGGKITTSSVVSVSLPVVTSLLIVAPNPVRGNAVIHYTSRTDGAITARLYAMSGVMVWNRTYAAGEGARLLNLEGLPPLGTGVYILQCTDGTYPEKVEVMVTR